MTPLSNFLIPFASANLALLIFNRPLARIMAKYFPGRPKVIESDARFFLIATGIINPLGCLGFWLLAMHMNDTVTDHYSTRSEAEKASLFERGWLPEIIPPSSYDITTNNNLDRNTSYGNFAYHAKDHHAFIAQLTRDQSLDNLHDPAYTFKEWTFLINETNHHCRYQYRSREP